MNRSLIMCFVALAVLGTAAVANAAESFQNPLPVNSITELVARVLKAIVMIALPIISLFIVYSGFLFVWARGNEEGLNQAKRNFLYVIIGSLLILGAWILATLIGGTIGELTR